MLVSAAIEPYRKSYGNSLNSAATLGGRNWSERITASPRNTWVPGVHAWAAAGATARSTSASHSDRGTENRQRRRAAPRTLDPKALAPAADRPSQILELRRHGLVDRVAGRARVAG